MGSKALTSPKRSLLDRILAPVASRLRALGSMSSVDGRGGWRKIFDWNVGKWQQDAGVNYGTADSYWANFACYTLIASDFAKMPIAVMEYNRAKDIWVKTVKRPILRKPNHYQTTIEFLFYWMVSQLRHGNTYALKMRNQEGFITALFILDPCFVTPLVADDGGVYYKLSGDKLSRLNRVPKEGYIVVPASEIIHDRMYPIYHPLVGVAPIFACGLQAMQGSAIIETSSGFFANRGLPAGVLTAPGHISDDTARRLKEYFDNNFTGQNAGRVAVLGDNLKFESLASKAADAQLIEQLKMTGEMIAACYKVPGYKIGVGPMPSVSNVAALNQQYYDQCLHFLVEKFEARMDEGLELFEDEQCWMDESVLMRMDPQMRSTVLGQRVKDGIISTNEARREDNRPPVKGGEVPLVQQQNYSLEALARRDALDKERSEREAKPPDIEGAQLASVQSLLLSVSDGRLPVETVAVLIAAAVPSLTQEEIDALLSPLKELEDDRAAASVAPSNGGSADEGDGDAEDEEPSDDEDKHLEILAQMYSKLHAEVELCRQ